MRIALVSTWSGPSVGGIGAYVSRLLWLLHQAGHEVCLLHDDGGPLPPLPDRTRRVSGLSRWRPAQFSGRDQAMAILSEFAPDVVHVHDAAHVHDVDDLPVVESARTRYPVVRSAHNHGQHCPAGTRLIDSGKHLCDKLIGPGCLVNMAVRRCTAVRNPATLWEMYQLSTTLNRNDRHLPLLLVASRYARTKMLANGFAEDQVAVVPYFADPPAGANLGEQETGPAARPGIGDGSGPGTGSDRPRMILFTGRIVADKGLTVLIRAAQRIRVAGPWKLVVDGAGPGEAEARQLAAELGLAEHVEFLGWCSPDRHAANYAAADVVVMPSMWPEPFGLVGIEAMAHGKPVVAFAVGGMVDWLVHGQTGFLVDRGDIGDLARRLEQLLTDDALAAAMGASGRQRAATEYSPQTHLRRIVAAYVLTIERFEGRQH